MDKRTFLQTTSAILTGTILSGVTGCRPGREPLTNWAGNLEYSTNSIHYPATMDEAVETIKKSRKLRPLGSQHSFNTIADSEENLLSSKRLNGLVSLDKENMSVTVEGGIKYGELVEYLHNEGYALHNLASLPHISIAGSVATATHGSGVKNGNLATGVSAIEFINGRGNVIRLSKDDGELFHGAVVNLGALGFVTRLTLDLRPTFNMKQVVYRNLPMQQLRENFHAIMSSGYSVSLFTNWRNRNINQVWIKYVADAQEDPAPEFYGAKLAERNMHPVEDQSAESCTEQMGVPGPWYQRMPHFKMGFTPSTGKELQSEYFVPLENGYEALMAVEKLHSKIEPHLFISEIRAIDADNLWMSPCYKKPCVAIHTTWKQDWNSVVNLLPLMEKQLAPFNPRPHWGKLFTLKPSVLHERIEKLGEFRALVGEHDPEGKFRNAFLEKHIFNTTGIS